MSPNPQSPNAFHLPSTSIPPPLSEAQVCGKDDDDDDGNDVGSVSVASCASVSLSFSLISYPHLFRIGCKPGRSSLLERARDWRLVMSRHSFRRLMKY